MKMHLEHAEPERGAGLAGEQVDDLVPAALEDVGGRRKIPWRTAGGVAAHAGNASAAASTACARRLAFPRPRERPARR